MKTIAGVEADRSQGIAQIFGKTVKIEQHLEDLGEGEQPGRLRTVIPFQIKSLNDEDRTIEFVGSTAAVDRYGDSITQAGWNIANFVKNPVVPWGHDYSMPPVAKALDVGLKEGNLTFKAQFATADEYAWADTIYKMYKGGYLRAFSVGFIPTDWDGDWATGYTFNQCELLEVSCVTVPANPEALVLAFKEGVLTEGERKSMVAQAEKLIKTLTDADVDAQNEDMETAKAITELKDLLATEITALKGAIDELTTLAKGGDEPSKNKPEGEPSDKPADEPAGGAGDEPEAKGLKLSAEDLRAAVKDATREVLDYQLGKIN